MARLNLEETLFTDPRFYDLISELGPELAAGRLVMFFRLAQSYWLKDELIPHEVFDRKDWSILEQVGFAERREEGVYCSGSEQQFRWIKSKVTNGRVGGEKNGKRIKTTTCKEATRSDEKLPEASLLFTLNSIKKEKEKKEKGALSAVADPPKNPVQKLITIWNTHTGEDFPKCRTVSSKTSRYRQAQARLKEEPDFGYWEKVVKKVSESSFCAGSNDRGWKANFAWLVRPDTHLKILEGVYDDKDKQQPKNENTWGVGQEKSFVNIPSPFDDEVDNETKCREKFDIAMPAAE